MQSDGFSCEILTFDIAGMFKACGWDVVECDGHDVKSLQAACSKQRNEKPFAIIANTIKGKGVPFMENAKEWHHSRLSKEQLAKALEELCKGVC
jgi:transketolase